MRARDVANYLLFVTSEACSDVSNMKINKLLYFAQGHALQQGFSLFDDEIVAGDHGPLVEDVYHLYEKWGREPITEWDEEQARNMPEHIRELLINVAGTYGSYSASQLRRMTHQPNTPWKKYYKPKGSYKLIPNDAIKDYFINNVSPINEDDTELEFIGYRDSEGYVVLPKSMK